MAASANSIGVICYRQQPGHEITATALSDYLNGNTTPYDCAYKSASTYAEQTASLTPTISYENSYSTSNYRYWYFFIWLGQSVYSGIQSSGTTTYYYSLINSGTSTLNGATVACQELTLGMQYTGLNMKSILQNQQCTYGGITYYGFRCYMRIPKNLTQSDKTHTAKLTLTCTTSSAMTSTFLPVSFQISVTNKAYVFSTTATVSWNTGNYPYGIVSPLPYGTTGRYTFTITNNEDASAASATTLGKICIGNGSSSFNGTYGSAGLSEAERLERSYKVTDPVYESSGNTAKMSVETGATFGSGCGYRYITCYSNANYSFVNPSGQYYVYPGQTLTLRVDVSALAGHESKEYVVPYISYKCVGASSGSTSIFNSIITFGPSSTVYSTGALELDGTAPSGARYLLMGSDNKVYDFKHNVEDAGPSSMTTTTTAPVYEKKTDHSFDGHLAYQSDTDLSSPRYRCLDIAHSITSYTMIP